jgi:hypothetical protein
MLIDTENATKARVFPNFRHPEKGSTGPKSKKLRFLKTAFPKKKLVRKRHWEGTLKKIDDRKETRELLQQKFKRNLWIRFYAINISSRKMALLGRKRHFSFHRGKRPSFGLTEPYTKVGGRVASREIARTKSLTP